MLHQNLDSFYRELLFIITEKMQSTSYNPPNCPLCQNTLKKRKRMLRQRKQTEISEQKAKTECTASKKAFSLAAFYIHNYKRGMYICI